MPLSERAALKLLADLENAVREHAFIGYRPSEDQAGIQRRYDIEHTRVLTVLTGA